MEHPIPVAAYSADELADIITLEGGRRVKRPAIEFYVVEVMAAARKCGDAVLGIPCHTFQVVAA